MAILDNPITNNLISKGQVYLSFPTRCTSCDSFVRLIGEHKTNGSWYCPVCASFWEYNKLSEAIPWEKRFWKVQDVSEVIVDKSPMSSFYNLNQESDGITQVGQDMQPRSSILFGDSPAPNFPMNLSTGYLVPSYGYKIRRERKYLLAVAEDGTRTGRVKGGFKWGFELIFKNRFKDECDTLIGFWETQGYALPFDYTDPFKGTEHICYFDSKIELEVSSFDNADMTVTIIE